MLMASGMTDAPPWTCPTCNTLVTTPFCARCGEGPVPAQDLTLRGLGDKLFHAFTSIDSRTAHSIWSLLRHPGELTRAWANGIRKPYIGPFQLFLFVNVIFFAVQSLTGETVFSSSLDSHLHHQDWSEFAHCLLARKLENTHTSLADYASVFDRVVVVRAKSLIVLMTVPFAMLLPAVFLRQRRPFMVHVVFSLHLYTFLLLLFCAALLAAMLSAMLGFGGLQTPIVDTVLSIFNLAACALYVYLAIGPAYGAAGGNRILQTVVLAIAVAGIVLGYRFALLLITLSTT
jgi:hypothetical protein